MQTTRRALVLCFLAFFAALPVVSAAHQLVIQRFDEQVLVNADGTIDVTENITAQFNGSNWHGLYRSIPVEYSTPAGLNYTLFLEVLSVTDSDGSKLKYERSQQGRDAKFKIYVPDADNSTHTIVLMYRVRDAISFDANGNTLSDAQGRSFTWDFENRLTQVVNPGVGTTTFKYDPFGRRVQKSGPLGTTNYLYDGANLLEEMDQSGNVLARYTQDVGIDQLLSQLRSGTTSYYEQDALGSVISLSNGAGALAKTYSYDSFGKLTASTGTLTNPFQYSGREFDSETGLYYYRARYFDPSAGRFLSEDPLGFGAGDPNFYAYVGNAPTNMIDPSGKSAGAAPALGQAPAYCAANPVVCLGAIDGILLAYDSYEAYQLGVAYGWWGQPKPKQCDDDCGKLLAAIAAQMQIVQSRYAALMSDPLNLYNNAFSSPSASMPNAGTWMGHVDALADAQRGLQNRINAAKAKGCPIPPQAEFLAELPLPTKPGWRK